MSVMHVYDLCRPPELPEASVLMKKYAGAPMDFADATLVLPAEGLNVREVLTFHRMGFSIYRTRQRKGFRLVVDSR